jgi:mRNA interferase MazF
MTKQRSQRPRKGWIYMINPFRVSLRCKLGHIHFYDLNEPGEVTCKTASCSQTFNSSRVFRGTHPYIIWMNDEFQNDSGYIQTFIVIPLTSQETYKGFPTTYPINSTSHNQLERKSYALIHQLTTIDGNCLKDSQGNWLTRMGQIDSYDKESIERRLKYALDIQDNPSDDWFVKNASPELLRKIFHHIPEEKKQSVIEELIEDF